MSAEVTVKCVLLQVSVPQGYIADVSALSGAGQNGKKSFGQKPHLICILESSKKHCLEFRGGELFFCQKPFGYF